MYINNIYVKNPYNSFFRKHLTVPYMIFSLAARTKEKLTKWGI